MQHEIQNKKVSLPTCKPIFNSQLTMVMFWLSLSFFKLFTGEEQYIWDKHSPNGSGDLIVKTWSLNQNWPIIRPLPCSQSVWTCCQLWMACCLEQYVKSWKKGSQSVVFQQVDGGMPQAKANFMKLKWCFGLQMTSKLQVFQFDCIFPFNGLLTF